MDIGDVAVATVTWARDAAEERVLTAALEALATLEAPVAVSDRSPSGTLGQTIERLGFAAAPAREPGLVEQVACAVRAAARTDRPFILYTEPDKQDFFIHRLARFVRDAPGDADVGVVLASRSDASFATFPPLQRFTETTINTLTGDVLGQPGDYSYGPFLVRRELAAHLDRPPEGIGWGWRHFLFVVAYRLGFRVIHVVDDHRCPPGQHDENATERVHRLRQLSQNVDGLAAGLTASLPRPTRLRRE
jgi:hypothetical protein